MSTKKCQPASCKKAIPALRKPSAACGKKRVTFTYNGTPGAKVFLAGCFNDWSVDAKEMKDKKNDGVYSCQCLLAPGSYQYKFVVDGLWTLDDANPNFVKNDLGSLNSVLEI